MLLYAATGIQEYWVVDITRRAIHVHRQPQPGGYASVTVVAEHESIPTLQFPAATLTPARLFS
jgi:Uma2 family endonuclease